MTKVDTAARGDYQSESDEELVRAVLSGDSEAYRHLVLRYQHYLVAMLQRQTGNGALAEELAQEILVKGYVNLKSFRFEAKFATWLTRIAINHAANFFASRRFKDMQATKSFDHNLHGGAADSPEDEQVRQEQLNRLRLALAKLKPKLRAVLTLCALEEKSYEEAAQILDIPVGTVRSRLNKARLVLKEELFSRAAAEAAYEA